MLFTDLVKFNATFFYIYVKLTAMKQIFFLLVIVFTLTSCQYTTGSGKIVTETRTVGNFDGITVGGSFDVEVKIGPETIVEVEADDNVIRYIKTTVSGNNLKIRTENNHSFTNTHMKVFVTTPALKNISAAASADVIVEDVIKSTGKLSFRASSSASIQAEVDAPEIETDASSSATITLSGKTKSHEAKASSSADIRSFGLLSEMTTARVSSGATIQVHASISLNARASSSGDVQYKGAASVNKSVSSSGSVYKKD